MVGFFKFNFFVLADIGWLTVLTIILTFAIIDMFDTMGTIIGVHQSAGLINKGNEEIPGVEKMFMADSIATVAGACLGTSTTTTFVESAAGVGAGGRTGLTALTTAACFALALLFSPLFLAIPGAATAPALVIVGVMMMGPIVKIDWEDYSESIPAFITVLLMPVAYSISDGILIGVISYVLLNAVSCKFKKISVTMWILAVLFILLLRKKSDLRSGCLLVLIAFSAMILINVANVLRQVSDDPALDGQITTSIGLLTKYFIHPEFKALLETVGPNGEFIDTNAGRTINPGHCIETSWFLMDVALERGDKDLLATALQILDWSWAWGWDKKYGGVISFKDCRNLPPQCYEQDMKFWWPQCETIIATLYAFKLTGDEKYLKWHRRISDWTYAHFPDHEYGEWYGYLHRDGSVAQPAKGNIFKGPFHIPRMMVKAYTIIKCW